MNLLQTKKGFTIIEVVLVLAIAGLIFLMVFIALPALQRGQRDNARKNDISLVSSAVTNFTSANKGKFPTEAQLRTALGGTSSGTGTNTVWKFTELSNNTTSLSVGTSGTQTVDDDAIIVITGRKCDTASANGSFTTASGNSRQFVVVAKLEGNNGSAYCQES